MLAEIGMEALKYLSQCCKGPFHYTSTLCGPLNGPFRQAWSDKEQSDAVTHSSVTGD